MSYNTYSLLCYQWTPATLIYLFATRWTFPWEINCRLGAEDWVSNGCWCSWWNPPPHHATIPQLTRLLLIQNEVHNQCARVFVTTMANSLMLALDGQVEHLMLKCFHTVQLTSTFKSKNSHIYVDLYYLAETRLFVIAWGSCLSFFTSCDERVCHMHYWRSGYIQSDVARCQECNSMCLWEIKSKMANTLSAFEL